VPGRVIETEKTNDSKMPNDPTLDASVQWRIDHGTIDLREPGYRGTAEAILDAGLATEVRRLISAGKEADVYLCTYNGAPLAVKAYRLYRTSHRGGRPIKVDTMSWLAAQRVENLLSMRYIGNEAPAPRLHDVRLEAPESFLGTVLAGVDALARAGIVHGDLSAFNVLVDGERAWFIDFSEAVRVDRLGGSPWVRLTEASKLLTRGLQALQLYFRKYNLTIETEPLVEQIVQRLDRFGVLE